MDDLKIVATVKSSIRMDNLSWTHHQQVAPLPPEKWGMYDDIAELTGLDKRTLRKYKTIGESIESGLRRPDLSFSHHEQVAPLPPEKQKEFLEKASNEKLSVRQLE